MRAAAAAMHMPPPKIIGAGIQSRRTSFAPIRNSNKPAEDRKTPSPAAVPPVIIALTPSPKPDDAAPQYPELLSHLQELVSSLRIPDHDKDKLRRQIDQDRGDLSARLKMERARGGEAMRREIEGLRMDAEAACNEVRRLEAKRVEEQRRHRAELDAVAQRILETSSSAEAYCSSPVHHQMLPGVRSASKSTGHLRKTNPRSATTTTPTLPRSLSSIALLSAYGETGPKPRGVATISATPSPPKTVANRAIAVDAYEETVTSSTRGTEIYGNDSSTKGDARSSRLGPEHSQLMHRRLVATRSDLSLGGGARSRVSNGGDRSDRRTAHATSGYPSSELVLCDLGDDAPVVGLAKQRQLDKEAAAKRLRVEKRRSAGLAEQAAREHEENLRRRQAAHEFLGLQPPKAARAAERATVTPPPTPDDEAKATKKLRDEKVEQQRPNDPLRGSTGFDPRGLGATQALARSS